MSKPRTIDCKLLPREMRDLIFRYESAIQSCEKGDHNPRFDEDFQRHVGKMKERVEALKTFLPKK